MILRGYIIAPPIRPWDKDRRELIILDSAKSTFGETPSEAWRKHCQRNSIYIEPIELTRRVQHWFDRGYRVMEANLRVLEPKV